MQAFVFVYTYKRERCMSLIAKIHEKKKLERKPNTSLHFFLYDFTFLRSKLSASVCAF